MQEDELGHRNLGFSSALLQALGAVKPLPTQCPEQSGHRDQLQEEVDRLQPSWFSWLHWISLGNLSSLRPKNLGRI